MRQMVGDWCDWPWRICLVVSCGLGSLGLIMVYSSTVDIMAHRVQDPQYYLNRHLMYAVFGFVVAWLVYRAPVDWWRRAAPYMLALSVVLLISVLFVGIEVNGSRRWLGVNGLVTLQVSELTKLCCLAYLADHVVRHHRTLTSTDWAFLKPLAVILVPMLLLLKQPDFGSAVVLMTLTLGVCFLAGARLIPLVSMIVISGCCAFLLIRYEEYRWNRFISFQDPFDDPFGKGFQLVQSLISYGRGDLAGEGLGNSVQKLFFLPESHTDFIFAVISEELGLIGNWLVIAAFVVLVGSIFAIAYRASQRQQYFSAYFVQGIGLLMALQALLNFGVSMGALPTKGLTLPFISYGGSSLVINMILIAIVLRSALESQPVKRTSKTARRVAGPVRRSLVRG